MDQSNFLQSLVTAWDEPVGAADDHLVDETDSAPLNALIRAARMFVADRVTPQALFEEIRLVTVLLESAVRRHPDAEGLDGLRRALLALAGYFQDRDESRFEAAIAEIHVAAGQLAAGGVDLEATAEVPEARLACLVCGQILPPEAPVCGRCGAQAPATPVDATHALSAVPAEVIALAAEGEQVVAGVAGLEHWQALVQHLQEVVGRARQGVADLLEVLENRASSGLLDLGESMLPSYDEALSVLEVMAGWDGTQAHIHGDWAALAPALARARKAGEVFWENAAVLAPL